MPLGPTLIIRRRDRDRVVKIFFSPALVEADLMRRVLPAAEFVDWFKRFLPGIGMGEPKNLFAPVTVPDKTDGKLVHLDGLNLSRAWCMQNIANVIGTEEPVKVRLQNSALLHARIGLEQVASGHYEGEHWLATVCGVHAVVRVFRWLQPCLLTLTHGRLGSALVRLWRITQFHNIFG